MSRTFISSDGVSADALLRNDKFLLDDYILQGKTIPINLFGTDTRIAIIDAITYLTGVGGGSVFIPASGNNFELEIAVMRNRYGTFSTKYTYHYDRYPTVEARPYSGEAWQVGDTIINNKPDTNNTTSLGWICVASGTPGTWKSINPASVADLNFMGSLTYANLPTSPEKGDYYYCSDGNGTDGVGYYAWNGSSWNYIGNTGLIQISDYKGNNQNVVMSQRSVTGYLDNILEAFNCVRGHNIVDPNNAEFGYIDRETFQKKNSNNHLRTINPVDIPDGATKLYFYSLPDNPPDAYFCLFFLDSEDNFLSVVSNKLSSLRLERSIPAGAVKIHYWIGGYSLGMTMDKICLSFVDDGFEKYGVPQVLTSLKYEQLPDRYLSESERILATAESSLTAFDTVGGYNVFDYAYNTEYGAYSDDLTKLVSNNSLRTIKPIDIPQGAEYIYTSDNYYNVGSNIQYLVVLFINEEGSFISKITHRTDKDLTTKTRIPEGSVKFHIYVTGIEKGITADNFCVSFVDGPFDKYGNPKVPTSLKYEQLPEGYHKDREETNEEIIKLRQDNLDRDEGMFEPPNVIAEDAVNWVVGSMWSNGKIVTTQYTTAYNAVEEKIPVKPGDLYWFADSLYFLDLLDDKGNVIESQRQIKSYNGGPDDGKFTIPEGCYELCISFKNTIVHVLDNWGVFRLSITLEEREKLPLASDKFSLNVSNLKKDDIKLLIAPLKDKIIVNFGDSIFGNYRGADSISSVLAKLTGATVHNCGFGGCRMASHSGNWDAFSMYRLADAIVSKDWTLQDSSVTSTVPSYFTDTLALLKSIDFSNVDIITIAYGTNDLTGGKLLDDEDNLYDTSKFAGALRHSIETLLTAYPQLRIFICSQTYRFWMTTDTYEFTEDSDTKTFTGGKLTDFVDKTKEVADSYHLPFINNYNIGMNKFSRSIYFPYNDGTHPNPAGRDLLARHISKELY